MALRTLSLCSGYGGLELGLELAGVPTSACCYVEREAYGAANLVSLMESGRLDPAPIWSDLTTFDGGPWRGAVDLVTAGFPCQPFSTAGKRKGLDDERWLWGDIERIISEVGPGVVFLENVPGLAIRGLYEVLGSFASLGFDAEWGVLRASDAGAPHRRARIFILGVHPDHGRSHLWRLLADARRGSAGGHERRRLGRRELSQSENGEGNRRKADPGAVGFDLADTQRNRRDRRGELRGNAAVIATEKRQGVADADSGGDALERRSERDSGEDGQHKPRNKPHRRHAFPPGPGDADGWRRWIEAGNPQPSVCGGADGIANRVDQLRLLGNGVVPQQAAYAFRLLWERMR